MSPDLRWWVQAGLSWLVNCVDQYHRRYGATLVRGELRLRSGFTPIPAPIEEPTSAGSRPTPQWAGACGHFSQEKDDFGKSVTLLNQWNFLTVPLGIKTVVFERVVTQSKWDLRPFNNVLKGSQSLLIGNYWLTKVTVRIPRWYSQNCLNYKTQMEIFLSFILFVRFFANLLDM